MSMLELPHDGDYISWIERQVRRLTVATVSRT
jgi:hypothetical protein